VNVRPSRGVSDSRLDLLDPDLAGADGAGLPTCTARVDYAASGYAAAMGWVQFVRSSDSGDRFGHDPLALLRGVMPYAFFGVTPTLFDAPYREVAADLTWTARSYLAITPDAVMTRRVVPIVAFAWGFRITERTVAIDAPTPLELDTWSDHAPVLAREYPDWDIAAHAS
jgi:hypothetical protein